MGPMRYRMLSIVSAAGGLLLWPLSVLAEAEKILDARLEGYKEVVKLTEGSTALTWMLLVVLVVMCMAVLFKNANRSHLD
jgi:hypothetical protein